MANITKDDVLRLAKLSMLQLAPEQLEHFRSELESIVAYVDKLQAVDTDGLEPTMQVTGLVNVMRDDVIQQQCSPEDLLKNAPATEDHQIKVRRVLE